jgi:hypothetical protein
MDLDYNIYEYWGKYNNRYYKLKIIEDNIYDTDTALHIYHPNNNNIINYCGVIHDDGEHIRDITKEIRYFMHYKGLIEWKYILVHLGIEHEDNLFISMNDFDMSEIVLNISDIYHEKFNF